MKKRNLLLTLFFVPLALGGFFVPSQADTTGAAFLKIDPSPRSFALGQLRAVAPQGAQAVGSNPAFLQKMQKSNQFFSAYSQLLDGVQYGHGAFAMKVGERIPYATALGFSVTRVTHDRFEGFDLQGQRTGESLGAHDTAVAISVSGVSKRGIQLGLTGKILQSELAGYKSNQSLALDAGLGYQIEKFSWPLQVGISVNEMGQDVTFVDQEDPLPTTVHMGMDGAFGLAHVYLGASRKMEGGNVKPSMGIEMEWRRVAVRAGYQVKSGGSNSFESTTATEKLFEGFTSGLGLSLGRAQLDYALGQQGEGFGLNHRMALTLGW